MPFHDQKRFSIHKKTTKVKRCALENYAETLRNYCQGIHGGLFRVKDIFYNLIILALILIGLMILLILILIYLIIIPRNLIHMLINLSVIIILLFFDSRTAGKVKNDVS